VPKTPKKAIKPGSKTAKRQVVATSKSPAKPSSRTIIATKPVLHGSPPVNGIKQNGKTLPENKIQIHPRHRPLPQQKTPAIAKAPPIAKTSEVARPNLATPTSGKAAAKAHVAAPTSPSPKVVIIPISTKPLGAKAVAAKAASGKPASSKVTGDRAESQIGAAARFPNNSPVPLAPVPTDGKPRKNVAGLGVRDLEHFRELLLAKRRELVGDMTSMEREALRSANGTNLSNLPLHMADMGTDNYEQEFTLGLVEKERGLLRELNRALAKIQDGSYGICEGTGKPINRPRLEAQPWARFSIEYARMMERGLVRR
jgi:RNA polymerase-binding protein DksA